MVASAEPRAIPVKLASNRLSLHTIAGRALASLSPIGRAEAATPVRSAPHWTIQVGAFRAHATAARAGTEARAHAPAARGKPVVVVATRSRHGAVYNARITGLTESQAHTACETLRHEHRACAVLGQSVEFANQKAGGVTSDARS
jgi:hypothetical protein